MDIPAREAQRASDSRAHAKQRPNRDRVTIVAHIDTRRIPPGRNEPAQLATGHAVDGHRVHATQRDEECGSIRGQRDGGWREADLALAERRDRDCLDDAVAARVDHAHRVRVAVGDIQSLAPLVPDDARGMTAYRTDLSYRPRHEI